MKRIVFFLTLTLLTFATNAQIKDAATVYSEFQQQINLLRSSAEYTPEHEHAMRNMLELYPQLFFHAANYSEKGNTSNAIVFAQAYVDMAVMPEFENMQLYKSADYPTMVYFLGSNYYNRKEYASAVRYMELYIKCEAEKYRKAVFKALATAQKKLGDTLEEITTLNRALGEYPEDSELLFMSINARLENGMYEDAVYYLDIALKSSPGDPKLLSFKGLCYEGMGQYEKAADVYGGLAQHQKTINIYKHYALNLYNCAVSYNTVDPNRSRQYFLRAIPILKTIVNNEPTSVEYTTSLAMAYLYTDHYTQLAEVNERLRIMGAAEVQGGSANSEMIIMTSDFKRPNTPATIVASNKPAPTVAPSDTAASAPSDTTGTEPAATPAPAPVALPTKTTNHGNDFKTFAQNYIEKEINLWQQKDPFETIDEYTQRVTEETRNAKIEDLMKTAKRMYADRFQKQVRRSDFTLQPYDAENGVFLIKSRFGDIILPVARENDQARQFQKDWLYVQIENTELDVAGNDVVIRSMDFITPQGKVYHYSDRDVAKYSQADVKLQFNDIDYAGLGGGDNAGRQKVNIQKKSVVIGESDVDVAIPETKSDRSTTFAFIIGNENYQAVSPVPFALNDANSMKLYFNKTLGIPENNIRLYEDATFGKILGCVREIKNISAAYNGEIDIIFYYAGHGIPDEKSKSAYLLPVDADGTQTESCYSIGRLYTELGQLGANSVLVMMDACFSGAQRGEGMIASARGVALKAKPDAPQGNMVTLSAATGEETAYPYDEKQHGMFSYFIMKHLQETKGKTTLGALADYVTSHVRQQSVVINHKSQTPTVTASAEATGWRKWSLTK